MSENSLLVEEISKLKKEKNAVILAHTYQIKEVQDIADYVGDSYGLSVQAAEVKDADVIVFCGVRFMAETAAILSPGKTVILPNPDAGCPMADMIEPDELADFKAKYPGYLVMCYVNSTAEIKAMSDICCTSSNALKIAQQIPEDTGILFVPDKHLGSWVQEQTNHKMVMWDGFCPTHLRIDPETIEQAKKDYPNAPILIHPEAPKACRDLCDGVFSTGGMLDYVAKSDKKEFVIATEIGIINTLNAQNPNKTFHALTEKLVCPNMKKGTLQSLRDALAGEGGEIVKVDPEIAEKAIGSLEKMLEMSK